MMSPYEIKKEICEIGRNSSPKVIITSNASAPSNDTHSFRSSAPARSQAAVHSRCSECFVAVEGRTG